MDATAVRAFAPGKLILSGEHAVVYGHPAVALAVDPGTTVTLRRRPGPTALEQAPAEAMADPRLHRALRAVLPESGLGVGIQGALPIGRGMGSSASVAIALVRAAAALEGRVADFAECHARGFEIERAFHGNPSGVDHAVVALGGAVYYTRAGGPDGGPLIRPLTPPPLCLVVLDSGSAGNTAEMVAGVRARHPGNAGLLDEIAQVTARVVEVLDGTSRDPLGPLLTENHRLLARLGVSTPVLDELVALALGAGALGAKLAGAGGGGVVEALVHDPEPVLAAARARGVPGFAVGMYLNPGDRAPAPGHPRGHLPAG